jgi:hypothetical protein
MLSRHTAHAHSASLGDLVTAEGLADIAREALQQFQAIDFRSHEDSARRLRAQYREDAGEACALLAAAPARSSRVEAALAEIRGTLASEFWSRAP